MHKRYHSQYLGIRTYEETHVALLTTETGETVEITHAKLDNLDNEPVIRDFIADVDELMAIAETATPSAYSPLFRSKDYL